MAGKNGNPLREDGRKKEVGTPRYVKKNGRNYQLVNEDANSAIGRPTALEASDKELIRQVLAKYEQVSVLPIIESLIAENKPVKGLSEQFDPDYFVRKFMQIGFTATKPYDRILAMEKAARLMGYMNTDQRSQQAVKVEFNMHKPADSDHIDAEFIKDDGTDSPKA